MKVFQVLDPDNGAQTMNQTETQTETQTQNQAEDAKCESEVKMLERMYTLDEDVARTGQKHCTSVLALALQQKKLVDYAQRKSAPGQEFKRPKEWNRLERLCDLHAAQKGYCRPVTVATDGRFVVETLESIKQPEAYKGCQWGTLIRGCRIIARLHKGKPVRHFPSGGGTVDETHDRNLIPQVIADMQSMSADGFSDYWKLPQSKASTKAEAKKVEKLAEHKHSAWRALCKLIAQRDDAGRFAEILSSAVSPKRRRKGTSPANLADAGLIVETVDSTSLVNRIADSLSTVSSDQQ